jgi:hypothetical protein
MIRQEIIDRALTIEMQKALDEQRSSDPQRQAQGEAREDALSDVWWELRARGLSPEAPMCTEDLPKDREPRAGDQWVRDTVDKMDEKRRGWLK